MRCDCTDLAVQSRLQQQVAVVQAGDDHRSERPKGVGRFRAEPLEIVLLPVALAHVVASGDAEDVPRCRRNRYVRRALSNHDDQLPLEVHVLCFLGHHDFVVGSDDGRWKLGEESRIGGGCALAQVGLVVQADANHFRRLARRKQLRLGELHRSPAWRRITKEVPLQLSNGVPLEDAGTRRSSDESSERSASLLAGPYLHSSRAQWLWQHRVNTVAASRHPPRPLKPAAFS